MARLVPACCVLVAAVLLGGAGQLAPRAPHPSYSDAQKSDLDRVSAALNAIHTLESSFLQIGPQGQVSQGELYLEKPGKVRFAYSPPTPILIVATGGTVYVKNAKLNTVDHYDLSDTPLGLILDKDVDLKTNPAVTGVEDSDGAIVVSFDTYRTNGNVRNDVLVLNPAPDSSGQIRWHCGGPDTTVPQKYLPSSCREL